jgi:hypothetical protein
MLVVAENRWGLPFDFAGFDHQPSTHEVIEVARAVYSACPSSTDVWAMRNRVLNAFHNSHLVWHEDGARHKARVEGGLMSGLRLTSVVGNGWNTVMTMLTTSLLKQLGCDLPVRFWLRGDDSVLIFNTWAGAYLQRVAYAALHAIGHEAKFSILNSSFEFLRVRAAHGRLWGYWSRSLLGVVQRKPWNSDPWSEDAAWIAAFDALAICRRRGSPDKHVSVAESVLKNAWSHARRLPSAWLHVPKAMGGVGALPWSGQTVLGGGLRYAPRPNVHIHITQTTPMLLWMQKGAAVGITEPEAMMLAQEDAQAVVASDDVPDVARVLRRAVKIESVGRVGVYVTVPAHAKHLRRTAVAAAQLAAFSLQSQDLALPTVRSFGRFAKLQPAWDAASRIARIRGVPASSVVLLDVTLKPVIDWLSHRSSAWHRTFLVDWAFGTLPIGTSSINPAAASYIKKSLVYIFDVAVEHSRPPIPFLPLFEFCKQKVEQALAASSWYVRLHQH